MPFRFRMAAEQDALSLQMAQQEEAYKAQIVEEARRRMLEQHASQLQGFLPKGVLQSEDDLR